MFKRKKCDNCGEKVDNNYNYCPYCRVSLKDSLEEDDYGLLGKNDTIDIEERDEIRMPAGLNALFNTLLKNLNQQMKDIEQDKKAKPKNVKKNKGISISISSFGDRPPEIKVSSFGNPVPKPEEKKEKKVKLPASESGKFTGLPKKEPETNIRRLSSKVVYEIKLPGVKTEQDISIIQLENSIEIKALAGKRVFYKVIPISLPINNYDLSQGILTLELDSRE